jgi:hypothetical protein
LPAQVVRFLRIDIGRSVSRVWAIHTHQTEFVGLATVGLLRPATQACRPLRSGTCAVDSLCELLPVSLGELNPADEMQAEQVSDIVNNARNEVDPRLPR